MTYTISKTASVLDLQQVGPGSATYNHFDEDLERMRIVSIDRETYDALEAPRQITVTIEPGDTLS